jgi:hypothetical protein
MKYFEVLQQCFILQVDADASCISIFSGAINFCLIQNYDYADYTNCSFSGSASKATGVFAAMPIFNELSSFQEL